MKVGFIQVYNEANWIGYAVDQAMLLCDRVIVMEGSQFAAFAEYPERSDDGTLDIISDKMKAYPQAIKLMETVRDDGNYRMNQCNNFNLALDSCGIGDYFIKLDSDEFYHDEFIGDMNAMMDERDVDYLEAHALAFAFGFKWVFNEHARQVFVKKTPDVHFVPTCKPVGYGDNVIRAEGIKVHHYTFVKPRERIRMRMATSSFHEGMLEWFDKNWDAIELGDGRLFKYINKTYAFRRYDGQHPSILNGHPWHDIEDIRSLA